ncbi:hypothetical protein VNO77_18833 [Canavalia gladiata]|uniref:Uncharacterized protein n=1 Tax=Canavalia gladiata TaxID=3824 RepID=A0AAN9LM97_CANGL
MSKATTLERGMWLRIDFSSFNLFNQDAEVQTYYFKLVPLCSLHGVYNSNKQRTTVVHLYRQLQQKTSLLLLLALHSASTCLRLNKNLLLTFASVGVGLGSIGSE